MNLRAPSNRKSRRWGFTLEELVISMGIALGSIVGIISGYKVCMYRVEWASNYAAAQALAGQRLEQTRAARWELQSATAVDELRAGNFPVLSLTMETPVIGTNVATATVFTTISNMVSDPPMKWIRVDCVWTCGNRGPFTNTVSMLRAPDA